MSSPAADLRTARRSAAVAFWIYGCVLATWVSRIPTVKHRLGLSTGALGLALVGTPIGLVIAMRFAAALVHRYGSATTMRGAAGAASISLIGLALARDQLELLILLVPFGMSLGTFDIAMNAQGVVVERGYGRPIMAALHGSYSVGVLCGALGGSLAVRAGLAPLAQFLLVALLVGAVNLLGANGLLTQTVERDAPTPSRPKGQRPGARSLRAGAFLTMLGLIAFGCFFAEGAVDDWSGVYLHEARHASLAVAPLGAAAAGAGMTLGRLVGDRVIARVGRWSMLGWAALVGAMGMVVAVLAPSVPVAIAGYALLGLGTATIVPVAFSLAGNVAAVPPAAALARVTTLGYVGLFGSPTVIGLLAHQIGLRTALWLPAVLLVGVTVLSRVASRVKPADRDRDPAWRRVTA